MQEDLSLYEAVTGFIIIAVLFFVAAAIEAACSF